MRSKQQPLHHVAVDQVVLHTCTADALSLGPCPIPPPPPLPYSGPPFCSPEVTCCCILDCCRLLLKHVQPHRLSSRFRLPLQPCRLPRAHATPVCTPCCPCMCHTDQGPFRPLTHRQPACGRCPHCTLQLAVCAQDWGQVCAQVCVRVHCCSVACVTTSKGNNTTWEQPPGKQAGLVGLLSSHSCVCNHVGQ